jgi:hypothetical protein
LGRFELGVDVNPQLHFRVEIIPPQLHFRVGALARVAALQGEAVAVGVAPAAPLHDQLAGGDEAVEQPAGPLGGDGVPVGQALDAQLEGLPGMHVGMRGDMQE